jgi:osmotically-inducible protein OsmY
MKSDSDIKHDVTEELSWDPAVNATAIGVAVREGIVTLSGQVDSFAQKHSAERAAMRVGGVRGIALELEVRLAPHGTRTDTEIAQAALHALRWHSLVPDEKVKVEVEDGQLTLSGEVDFAYQRASAEESLRALVGVTAIDNRIAIRPRVGEFDIAGQIGAALKRHAERQARHIKVDVEGAVVTLSGLVDSLAEHDAAIGTAFASPGVARVVDRLEVAL